MINRVFSGTLKFDVFSGFYENGHHTEGDKNGAKMGYFLRIKYQVVYLKYLVAKYSFYRSKAKNTVQLR